jgi:hypothetical protein
MHFGGLLFAARRFHFTAHRDAAAWRQVFDLRFVIGQIRVGNDLDVRQA